MSMDKIDKVKQVLYRVVSVIRKNLFVDEIRDGLFSLRIFDLEQIERSCLTESVFVHVHVCKGFYARV